jgi:hypothetical protein
MAGRMAVSDGERAEEQGQRLPREDGVLELVAVVAVLAQLGVVVVGDGLRGH